jgi:hypothetical protein
LASVRPTAEDTALTRSRERIALSGAESPWLREILSQAKDQVPIGVPGQAGQTVVRVIGFRRKLCEYLLDISDSVAIAVANSQDSVSFRQVHPSVQSQFQIHGGVGSVVKNMTRFARSVTIGVGQDKNLVVRWTIVIVRSEMGVAADQPNSTGGIHIDTGRRDQRWMFGDQFQFDTWKDDFDLRRRLGRWYLKWQANPEQRRQKPNRETFCATATQHDSLRCVEQNRIARSAVNCFHVDRRIRRRLPHI